MCLLKNPNELSKPANFYGLIYGQPGIGKTTLALSAPKPVLIDADKGIHRVEPRHRVPSLPLDDYNDVIALFEGNELGPYETVVFDTFGKLLDRMAEYCIRENPKNGKGGGSLSLQGYGALKAEFQNLMRLAQGKGKNLIFVAHEKEEKDGDNKVARPDAVGSSGKDVVKEQDFMGYMESRDNKRTISFSPSDKFYAKNSLKLPNVIVVPDTDKGNTFIQEFIVDKTAVRVAEEAVENQKYDELIAANHKTVEAVTDGQTADAALVAIKEAPVMWDSQRVARQRLNEKIKSLGLAFIDGKFLPAPKDEAKDEGAANDQVSDNTVAA